MMKHSARRARSLARPLRLAIECMIVLVLSKEGAVVRSFMWTEMMHTQPGFGKRRMLAFDHVALDSGLEFSLCPLLMIPTAL